MNFENSLFKKFNIVVFNGIPTVDFIAAYDVENVEDQGDFFMEYRIDGEKNLDLISYEIYGDASYYWTIIMVNNIQDVFYDLPMSPEELRQYVIQKMKDYDININRYLEIYQQEEEINNNKRFIRLVRPEYLSRFITLIEEAV